MIIQNHDPFPSGKIISTGPNPAADAAQGGTRGVEALDSGYKIGQSLRSTVKKKQT